MIFRFLKLDKLAAKLFYFAVAVLLIALGFIIFYPTPGLGNKTTDRFSSSFSGKEEKISFLKDFINLPSDIEDAEYHIVYYSPPGLSLGGAEWDFDLIIKLKPEDIPNWLDKAEESPEEFDLSWAKDLLPESWQLKSEPKYFYKNGEMTVFDKEAVIFWRLSNIE